MNTTENNENMDSGNQQDPLTDLNETVRKQSEELNKLREQLELQEKLAFIGQLSAGIMHEIKNPLNFVNNFSKLSFDLITELKESIEKIKDKIDANILDDMHDSIETLEGNLNKILENGGRAERIIFGMLAQARENKTIELISTNINQMTEEYSKLAYQGVRGENKEFNLSLKFDLDNSIGAVNVVPQDFGRVIINIINNGCYALNEKKSLLKEKFAPEIVVSTKKTGTDMELRIKDNGPGMPQAVIDKLFKPFFTTKPVGKGTGLGLSICHDIIVNTHKGEINVNTKEGEFTEFVITIPMNL
jgi:signal transduction histidine kinase